MPDQSALTPRELEVYALLCQAKSNNEIAQLLGISVAAIEKHLANIYRKLGVRNRLEAVMKAYYQANPQD